MFQNIDGGLDIYGMLIKVSEDMELEERELMTESVSKQLSTGPLSLNLVIIINSKLKGSGKLIFKV